jgi:hypothetical protein
MFGQNWFDCKPFILPYQNFPFGYNSISIDVYDLLLCDLAALLSFDNHFPQPNSRFQPKSDDWR